MNTQLNLVRGAVKAIHTSDQADTVHCCPQAAVCYITDVVVLLTIVSTEALP